ncbi:hypothetical protein [Carboxylicivirga sp. N1Y90]|uniref:hypothetical protein n=1 Tax=Carboxylicivirga fragile TaxID=3417571 RepID=UPI003D34997F|nr:hypothetical protein [Marinilabiliaceae bacterium N1Y90]
MKIFKIVIWIVSFTLLILITQIGGIALIISSLINKYWNRRFILKSILLFSTVYLLLTYLLVPILAPLFGRERIRHSDKIRPGMYLTVLLNRNYVVPEINEILNDAENQLKGTEICINYLDANFPFINKFPLPPHLSHNDGKKIDFALVYQDEEGKISCKTKSVSGYGVFEEPRKSEPNQIRKCLNNGYYQYSFPKYFTLGEINKDLNFSEKGTALLIKALLKSKPASKIFIEPHLKYRLGLKDNRIRYHGCKSVRHDDHIHVQVK